MPLQWILFSLVYNLYSIDGLLDKLMVSWWVPACYVRTGFIEEIHTGICIFLIDFLLFIVIFFNLLIRLGFNDLIKLSFFHLIFLTEEHLTLWVAVISGDTFESRFFDLLQTVVEFEEFFSIYIFVRSLVMIRVLVQYLKVLVTIWRNRWTTFIGNEFNIIITRSVWVFYHLWRRLKVRVLLSLAKC